MAGSYIGVGGQGYVFKKNDDPNQTMTPLGAEWAGLCLLSCIVACFRTYTNCPSVRYDERTRHCTPGSVLYESRDQHLPGEGTIYYSVSSSFTCMDFQMYATGDTRTCAWVSLVALNYTDAMNDCMDRGSHLYTVKDKDKLDILFNITRNSSSYWLGLDDIGEENVFRWVDDNTTLTIEMRHLLFQQALRFYGRADTDMMFKETDAGELHMTDFDVVWRDMDLLTCVIRCVSEFKSCYSVNYNMTTRLCIPGSWLISNNTIQYHAQTRGVIYSTGAKCNETEQFVYHRKADVTTCYWISVNQFNYEDSRDDCIGKNAHLYTIKLKEKFAILREISTGQIHDVWIGLDSLQKKGVLRWVDDNSRLTGSLKHEIFQQDERNNWTVRKNCTTLAVSGDLTMKDCKQAYNFVCEMNPFSK
ncbi:unnamed protein product [Lymnaea stagnalis]|uniref:C-type lectin domain-containing protein n=1 Tax=Lymnaea stagnalis TaxID=6523 RepID=A0AAV2GXY6_LYMST